MSRRAHIVRTQTQPRGPSVFRLPEGPFSWNASLQQGFDTVVVPGEEVELTGPPHHSSLGSEDFVQDGTYFRVCIPRDGIYSVSAVATARSVGPIGTFVNLYLKDGSSYGYLGGDCRPTAEDPLDPGGPTSALLQTGNAGYPFTTGQVVWVVGFHFDNAASLQMALLELSVTYEAELGTIYPPAGGGG